MVEANTMGMKRWEGALLAVSAGVTSTVGAAAIYSYWASRESLSRAATNASVFVLVMLVVHAVGAALYREQQANPTVRSARPPAVLPRLLLVLTQQIPIGLLAAGVLDGGRVFGAVLSVCLGHWVAILMVLLRERRTPFDYALMTWGYVPMLILAFLGWATFSDPRIS